MSKDKAPKKTDRETSIRKALKVCEYYSIQRVTIASACEAAGVPYRTFRHWCVTIAEVAEAYKKAIEAQGEIYKDALRLKAPSALEKLIDGWEGTEEHKDIIPEHLKDGVTIPEQVVGIRKVRKKVGPNPTAVIFALKNLFPASFASDEAATRVNVTATATAAAPGTGNTPADLDRLAQIQARTFEIARAKGLLPLEAFIPGAKPANEAGAGQEEGS